MNEQELTVLIRAAQTLKISPQNLKARNPFELDGDVARSMQAAVAAIDPAMAARWSQAAGNSASLEAAAAKAGLVPMTAGAHQQLVETDPDYLEAHQAAVAQRERDLLAGLEEAADAMAARRAAGPQDQELVAASMQRMKAELFARHASNGGTF